MNRALLRYPIALPVAAVVTLAIFFLMQALIATGRSALSEDVLGRVIDFVRVKEPEPEPPRERKVERPPTPEKPPAPPQTPRAETSDTINQALSIGAAEADIDIDLSAGLTGGGGDGDILPIVKAAPVYPQRALQRGLEGWVLVEFTVTASGSVKEVKVVDADPKGVFEEAAREAALKFRYKPRVSGGEPIEVVGVQNLIRFELER